MDVTEQHASVPNRLRAERERQGLSLRELAYFAGTSHSTVRRLELGSNDVAPAVKARVARALRVPVSELFEPEPVEVDE